MKRLLIVFSLLISIATYSQGEKNFYLGYSIGAGATVGHFKDNFQITDDKGAVIASYIIHPYSYGYHIPISLPILYGSSKWRIGLAISYEYNKVLGEKTFSVSYPVQQPQLVGQPEPYTQKLNLNYHLIKAGAIFEYDFWVKKKFALGLTSEFGYYAYVKTPPYATKYMNPPFLYGGLGLQSSYTVSPGLQLLYDISLDMQGYITSLPESGNPIFFQPRLTIGIRKAISLKSKKGKS